MGLIKLYQTIFSRKERGRKDSSEEEEHTPVLKAIRSGLEYEQAHNYQASLTYAMIRVKSPSQLGGLEQLLKWHLHANNGRLPTDVVASYGNNCVVLMYDSEKNTLPILNNFITKYLVQSLPKDEVISGKISALPYRKEMTLKQVLKELQDNHKAIPFSVEGCVPVAHENPEKYKTQTKLAPAYPN